MVAVPGADTSRGRKPSKRLARFDLPRRKLFENGALVKVYFDFGSVIWFNVPTTYGFFRANCSITLKSLVACATDSMSESMCAIHFRPRNVV